MTVMAPPVDVIVALVVAPFIGSFLGVVALHWPEWRAIVWGRSACGACGRRLRAYELIPLISWAALRGRCATCRARIPLMIPAIEIAALVPPAWAAFAVSGRPMFWITCVFGWQLIVLAAIDLRLRRLPDLLTLVLLASGLGVAAWRGAITDALIGAFVGGAALFVVAWVYRRIRKRDGLGEGDGKLAAGLGAWVGWMGFPTMLSIGAVATLAALLLARKKIAEPAATFPIPFGPGLALGAWIVWLYGPIAVA